MSLRGVLLLAVGLALMLGGLWLIAFILHALGIYVAWPGWWPRWMPH